MGPCSQLVKVLVQFGNPALREPLVGGDWIYLRDNAHSPCYHCCLGLRSGHSPQPRCHEQHPSQVRVLWQAEVPPCCIEDRYRGAMHNPLRTDVHVRPGSHLSVLRHAKSAHTLVIGLGRVVRYDQPIGHDCHWGVFGGWEQTHWVAGVHHECLVLSHDGQVLHGQQVLRPVLEH